MRFLKGSTQTVWTEAAVVVALLASMLSLFSLIGSEWADRIPGVTQIEMRTIGLWYSCGLTLDGDTHMNVTVCTNIIDGVSCSGNDVDALESWHVACQVVYTLGVGVSAVALVILTVFQCCANFRQNRVLLVGFVVLETIGGILSMAATILFGESIPTAYPQCGTFRTSWSLDVAATSAAFIFVSVVLALAQLCRFPLGVGETQRLHNEAGDPGPRDMTCDVQMDDVARVTSMR